MALTISKLCQGIAPSVTLAINAKVAEMKKQGLDVISMGAGEPDFDTPRHIRDAAERAIEEGKTRYTASSGIPELRSAIAASLLEKRGLHYSFKQVIVCNGAKQALLGALQAILDEGDEVILPEPCWVSYPEMVHMAGGVAVPVRASREQGFVPTREQLRQAVTPRTKAIIINNPSNPTGVVWTREQVQMAADVAREFDFYIISDEIYDQLVFDGAEHVCMPTLSEDAYNRTILINGFSKTYAMTGWRLGYAAGPENVMAAMGAFQSHATGNPCSVAQYAALAAVTGDQTCVSDMTEAFARRRDMMVDLARLLPDVTFAEPKGAFYILLDMSAWMGHQVHGFVINDSNDFAQLLLSYEKVAVVPGEAFGAPNCCRLSYAIGEDRLMEAMKRLRHFLDHVVDQVYEEEELFDDTAVGV